MLGFGGWVLAGPFVLLTASGVSDWGAAPWSLLPRGLLPAQPGAAPQSSIGCDQAPGCSL